MVNQGITTVRLFKASSVILWGYYNYCNYIMSRELICLGHYCQLMATIWKRIRNQQARGSTPRAGSNEIKGLANKADPIFIPG